MGVAWRQQRSTTATRTPSVSCGGTAVSAATKQSSRPAPTTSGPKAWRCAGFSCPFSTSTSATAVISTRALAGGRNYRVVGTPRSSRWARVRLGSGTPSDRPVHRHTRRVPRRTLLAVEDDRIPHRLPTHQITRTPTLARGDLPARLVGLRAGAGGHLWWSTAHDAVR